jgi:hypothetical protein
MWAVFPIAGLIASWVEPQVGFELVCGLEAFDRGVVLTDCSGVLSRDGFDGLDEVVVFVLAVLFDMLDDLALLFSEP